MEEPKQLKLIKGSVDKEEGLVGKKEKKEKEPKANKWFILFILIFTVGLTLFFYFSGGKGPAEEKTGGSSQPVFGGEKIYEF
jgi:hypothetical protein